LALQKTLLGRTGLEVGVAGLGGGGHSRLGQAYGHSHDESVAVVRRAIDLGVDFIDTAFLYGTEAIVGQAIRESGERVVVSTKCAPERNWGKRDLVTGEDVMRFAEQSLKRLGLDTIDIYNLHGVVPELYDGCRDELVPALIKLQEQGKIRFPGITEQFIVDPSHVMLDRALEDDFFDVVMVGYNLLNPSAARSVFPRTQAARVGTQIMFAVRRALSNPEALIEAVEALIERGEVDPAGLDRARPLDFLLDSPHDDPNDDPNDDSTGGPRAGANDKVSSIVEAAYRFCRHTPGADVILTGTGSLEHLAENLDFIQGPPLAPTHLARLEGLFGDVDSVSGN
jgi:L-galactose dehydrogenase